MELGRAEWKKVKLKIIHIFLERRNIWTIKNPFIAGFLVWEACGWCYPYSRWYFETQQLILNAFVIVLDKKNEGFPLKSHGFWPAYGNAHPHIMIFRLLSDQHLKTINSMTLAFKHYTHPFIKWDIYHQKRLKTFLKEVQNKTFLIFKGLFAFATAQMAPTKL